MRRLLEAILYFASGFFPKDHGKALFGSWHGKKFSDNPKYLLLHLANQSSQLDLVWIGDESIRSQIPAELPVRFVVKDSLAAQWEMLTAKTVFVTHSNSDIGKLNLMRGARRVYLGHGLAIKNMGSKDIPLKNPILQSLRRTMRNLYSFRFYVASSNTHRTKLLKEYSSWNVTEKNIANWGQPRVDYLLNNLYPEFVSDLRMKFHVKYGVPTFGKIITYLPTFRDNTATAFSFCELKDDQLKLLEDTLSSGSTIVLEKSHFAAELNMTNNDWSDRVIPLSSFPDIDTQELLMITDLLITDYSGCFVDFLVLDRPILHFAYDRKVYENTDRGLYFDLDEVAGGPIIEKFEDLCTAINNSLGKDFQLPKQHREAKRLLATFEVGSSCQQLSQDVFRTDLSRTMEIV